MLCTGIIGRDMIGLWHLRVIEFEAEQERIRALAQLSAGFAGCAEAMLPCDVLCTW